MPRGTADSIEAIIAAAVDGVAGKLIPRIQKALADAAATAERRKPAKSAAPRGRRSRTRKDIAKWTADRNARRVPTFVIEATGLDTKKKIVAKFGANVTFEKGKPLPTVASNAEKSVKAPKPAGAAAARLVKAKPPIIRKAAR
jgi:hypothetical protein